MKDDLETISWKVRVRWKFIGMLSFLRIQTMKRVKTKVMLSLKRRESQRMIGWYLLNFNQTSATSIRRQALHKLDCSHALVLWIAQYNHIACFKITDDLVPRCLTWNEFQRAAVLLTARLSSTENGIRPFTLHAFTSTFTNNLMVLWTKLLFREQHVNCRYLYCRFIYVWIGALF